MSIEHAVVVGTGLTAPGIAGALASAGVAVTVVGRSVEKAEAVAGRAGGVRFSAIEPPAFASVDLVVETVVEDAAVKTELLGRIEAWCPASAILTSNTSSFTLGAISGRLSRPERFAGLHFLNPADQTALVEIVRGAVTDSAVVGQLNELAVAMAKIPVNVHRDVPGFLWNRLQAALFRECLHVLEEGIADIDAIDAAISDGLAPRWMATGPLATADMGGTPVFRAVAEQLFPELSCASAPLGALGKGEPFYGLDDAARERIGALRAETLAVGAEFGARRREIMHSLGVPDPT